MNPKPIGIFGNGHSLYTTEQRAAVWGIEGENRYMNDEGRIERPDEQRVLQQDNRWRIDNVGAMLRDWLFARPADLIWFRVLSALFSLL